MKIKHHPAQALLVAHQAGDLPLATSAALAAHLAGCSYCQAVLAELEEEAAGAFEAQSLPVRQDDFDALLARLDQAPPAQPAPITLPSLSVNGESFVLPKALGGLVASVGSWRRLGSKVWSADLDLGDKKAKASFLYVDSHTRIPKHTHGGEEITLVLSGSLADEGGRYGEGDFLLKTPADEHQPYTQDSPCLCFTVLSAPLVFTGPLGRLANPLLRLFF
ncbi:ChrR family anti-sigma-E factor [Gallaecimonas xiamenensis]|uniref:Putative transcriptional regulator n=1 Tax=Gallaecimonas xiamenensis 3-C-1 TaxID=745411 RepID=K2J157_9GAMM|nr:ChrR family anti-sigma-E factor [Gallaecimonas xiamenensis]EKE76641.1 putative transcriptional regulator [Gallaecimonas xiamenensis 3-C-1]